MPPQSILAASSVPIRCSHDESDKIARVTILPKGSKRLSTQECAQIYAKKLRAKGGNEAKVGQCLKIDLHKTACQVLGREEEHKKTKNTFPLAKVTKQVVWSAWDKTISNEWPRAANVFFFLLPVCRPAEWMRVEATRAGLLRFSIESSAECDPRADNARALLASQPQCLPGELTFIMPRANTKFLLQRPLLFDRQKEHMLLPSLEAAQPEESRLKDHFSFAARKDSCSSRWSLAHGSKAFLAYSSKCQLCPKFVPSSSDVSKAVESPCWKVVLLCSPCSGLECESSRGRRN
jgi:hypothetical protein